MTSPTPSNASPDVLRDIYLLTGRTLASGDPEVIKIPFTLYGEFQLIDPPPEVDKLLAAGAVFGEVPGKQAAAQVDQRAYFVNLAALDPPGTPVASPSDNPGLTASAGGAALADALYVRRDDATTGSQVVAIPWSTINNKDLCPKEQDPGARGRMLFLGSFGVVVANLLVNEPIGGLTCYLVNLTSLRTVDPKVTKTGHKVAGKGGAGETR